MGDVKVRIYIWMEGRGGDKGYGRGRMGPAWELMDNGNEVI